LNERQDLSPDEVIPYWSRRKFARFIIGVAVIAFACLPINCCNRSAQRGFHGAEPVRVRHNPLPFTVGKTRATRSQWSEFFVISMGNGRKPRQLKISSKPSRIILMTQLSCLRTQRAHDEGSDSEYLERFAREPGPRDHEEATRVELGQVRYMAWLSGTYELTMNDAAGSPD